MSAFTDLLEDYLGTASDTGDVRAIVRRCFAFDFVTTTVRMWRGQGKLFTTGGVEWFGTVDANGVDHLQVPSLDDGRDGTSKRYEFALPYIDAATYAALKASQDEVAGRLITGYHAIFRPGEGLRPETPIDFFGHYTMQSPVFEERLSSPDGATFVKTYKVSVIAKNGNSGRSRAGGGTYSDTGQKARAALLGVSLDRGCEFVATLANRTFQIP